MPAVPAPRPRVAYLLKKFPRLSETFILNELLGQEELGRDLHIFSRRSPDDEPRHPQLAGLRASVEVLPSSRELDPWGALFTGDDDGLIALTGDVVRRVRPWGHEKFPSLLAEALYLLHRTRELGVEHLHVHFATDSAVTAHLLHALGGPSYSITGHAKDIYRETVRWHVTEELFAASAFVVTVCDANLRHLQERVSKRAADRVRRLYNGIDLDSFAFTSPTRRDEDHILAVGRLVPKKGFDVLLNAFERLLTRRPRARLTLVGAGECEAELRERARALGPAVKLTGPLDQGHVRGLMARATAFCLPCIVGADGNRDALPTVLLEALACGLPCIATPVTGIPEIFAQGTAGILVPERDVEATAAAMELVLADADLRSRLAAGGRAHAEATFDQRVVAKVLHSWFDEALETVPCASPA